MTLVISYKLIKIIPVAIPNNPYEGLKHLAKNFKIFETKVMDKKKGFKAWIQKNSLAYKSWYGTLSSTDKLIFDCYPSLERIEDAPKVAIPNNPYEGLKHLAKNFKIFETKGRNS